MRSWPGDVVLLLGCAVVIALAIWVGALGVSWLLSWMVSVLG